MAISPTSLSHQLPKYREATAAPSYHEAPLFAAPPGEAFAHLSAMDWSFSDDYTRFLAHDIHPYPAKFIPQIPGTLIATLSARGELVLDCFGGSGTTALEAVRLGRRALSIDANPLSALLGRAKTARVDAAAALELNGFQAALLSELQSISSTKLLLSKYSSHAPYIPNREKWFSESAYAELCLIKSRIASLESAVAKDLALVALSRIAIRASFQDSETRYKSVVREVLPGETLKRYLREFSSVMDSVAENEASIRYGVSEFMTGDVRDLRGSGVRDASVDLIVTSPPYGNATDYHLYHRFRLLWLGFDPTALGRIEIGSHLKHQREESGFESYYADLSQAVQTMARVLRPSRYAALVLGDSIYEGVRHDPAERIQGDASQLGFDACHVIDRPVHNVKRSFAHAGRRATVERIVIMRRRSQQTTVTLSPPPYKMWPYERALRLREAGLEAKGQAKIDPASTLFVDAAPDRMQRYRGLVFSHSVAFDGTAQPTWQAIIENGAATSAAGRKDPKYVTHGLHTYKGKFYPQLAKALLNLADLHEGARVLDPFCGSGTTLLESHLNGCAAYGCDLNPLAAKIARAKIDVLQTNPDVLTEAVRTVLETMDSIPSALPSMLSEFGADCHEEIARWFPPLVARKLNWVLKVIRKNSAGAVRDFLEVILSDIIREVSHQDPTDLRIRYRKELAQDADVIGLYRANLELQFARIEKFWKVRGWAPFAFYEARAIDGDNRSSETYSRLGIDKNSVDLILTSPPYGTALPYIDTDRLSLLTIMGLSSSARRPLEAALTGSREISVGERRRMEAGLSEDAPLPRRCTTFIEDLRSRLSLDKSAGFRKRNMPALMTRYLRDMAEVFENIYPLCKPGADAMIVIGDNKMIVSGEPLVIPTTQLVSDVATSFGFREVERISISVTTENMLHQKNAITENVVLRLRRPVRRNRTAGPNSGHR